MEPIINREVEIYMMKDIINLDDSNKNLNVSKEKVDILIREIKAKYIIHFHKLIHVVIH